MDLVLATNNKDKIFEMRTILAPYFDNIYSLSQLNINHETIEDGNTFAENAYKKAYEICQISHMPSLADDSGICVDYLNGMPGIYSARFSGEHGNDKENNKLLLEKMKDVSNRKAYYQCNICLYFPDGNYIESDGRFNGEIYDKEVGNSGFGYDPLFYLPEYGCTVGELDYDIKNKICHRAKALSSLVEKLSSKNFLK